MPEKLGNGGHGPENYDPNNGKYTEDGMPNKSYDNPKEKILGSLGIEEGLDNLLENLIDSYSTKEKPKTLLKEMIKNLPESEYKDIMLHWLRSQKKDSICIKESVPIDRYDRKTGKIEFSLNTILKKDIKTITHEIGHAINNHNYYKINGAPSDWPFSFQYENERGFTNSMELGVDWKNNQGNILNDFANFKNEIFKEAFNKKGWEYSDEKQFTPEEEEERLKVFKEKIQPKYANISDAVSHFLGSSYGLCGVGHKPEYWNNQNIADEFFANCFESLVTNNKDEIELYEKYFPNAFKTTKDSILQIYDKIKGEDLYG